MKIFYHFKVYIIRGRTLFHHFLEKRSETAKKRTKNKTWLKMSQNGGPRALFLFITKTKGKTLKVEINFMVRHTLNLWQVEIENLNQNYALVFWRDWCLFSPSHSECKEKQQRSRYQYTRRKYKIQCASHTVSGNISLSASSTLSETRCTNLTNSCYSTW